MPKKICIIGAGAAGLCAGRNCIAAGHNVQIFELQHDIGGVWKWAPEWNGCSVAYDELRSIVPIQHMQFEALPFTSDSPSSFVFHSEVYRYLREYSDPIRSNIHFNTKITKLEPIEEPNSNATETKWRIHYRQMLPHIEASALIATQENPNSEEKVEEFDVVFVANGHYQSLRIPEEFSKSLRIPWIHSSAFRRASEYRGKKVVIVGAGFSGVDLSHQIAETAEKVYFLHSKPKFPMPSNVEQKSRLVGVENGTVLRLADGSQIHDADFLIFCTGYRFSLPFLSNEVIHAASDGRYLSPLYLHFLHPKYTRSLFFLGINLTVILFSAIELQTKTALRLISGQMDLKALRADMELWEEKRLRSLESQQIKIEWFHATSPKDQREYFGRLAELAAEPSLPPVMFDLWDYVMAQRGNNLRKCQQMKIQILDDKTFRIENGDADRMKKSETAQLPNGHSNGLRN